MSTKQYTHPEATFISAFKRKAATSLEEARACLQTGSISAAVSRSYFGLYQAANAWMAWRGYDRDDREAKRRNWRHETVAGQWRKILEEIGKVLGPGVVDFDGPAIYKAVQDLRIQSDYKLREITKVEADSQFKDAERACNWLLAALEQEGY